MSERPIIATSIIKLQKAAHVLFRPVNNIQGPSPGRKGICSYYDNDSLTVLIAVNFEHE